MKSLTLSAILRRKIMNPELPVNHFVLLVFRTPLHLKPPGPATPDSLQ